jgi:hypothetical protein
MLTFQRLKRLYPIRPQVKKGNAEDRHRLRVPQYEGNPGWLFLTHNEEGDPIAMFVDRHENTCILYLVLDERMFSDTILRVVRIGPSRFLVYDIRYFNGKNIHETRNYESRKNLLVELIDEFHQRDLVSLEFPEEIPEWQCPLRGYECYDDEPGSLGVFLPANE